MHCYSDKVVEDIKNKILSILRKNPEGLTISKMASLVGIHRNTIPRYLYELKGEEKVRIREIGMAKLFYLNETHKKS
jgi:DNA-binding transcriptional ArsR family regulator